MASQETHDWWADVQDERESLHARGRRRPVAVWADEDDFDLVPEHVMARRPVSDELAPRRSARELDDTDLDRPARGHRFVRVEQPTDTRTAGGGREVVIELSTTEAREAPRRIVLEGDATTAGEVDHVLAPLEGAVQITGRPEERRTAASTRTPARRPTRSARELVEHQPDRIMFWVTALGFLLILLAFATG